MNILEEKQTKNYRIEIWYDDCAESPRDWDNLGTMVCSHNRYTLGDRQDIKQVFRELLGKIGVSEYNAYNYVDLNDYSTILNRLNNSNKFIVLPVYMYEHSAIALSTGDFGDRWDSGCIGFTYVDKEKVRKEYGVKVVTKKIREKVEKLMSSEVERYGHYVNGDCYGYTLYEKQVSPITGHENEEEIDSCGGFVGDLWDIEHNNWFDLPEEIAKELA